MAIAIVGAGMAGLLAANLLRHHSPIVYEAQPKLPNNHSAVLRFRTAIVGDALNIPFKPVTMIKDNIPWRNPVADALAYSFKNTGQLRSDRSILAGMQVGERWIAPPDLVAQMEVRLQTPVSYGSPFAFNLAAGRPADRFQAVISTIPMPLLMMKLGETADDFDHNQFKSRPGLNIRARIKNCDAYCTLSVPDPDIAFSRISITGDELIIEVPNFNPDQTERLLDNIAEQNLMAACELLGIDCLQVTDIKATPQKYAKIMPIDDAVRKDFMHRATDKKRIFSLGRFATWRPGLLLDDLVKDIRLIDRWISSKASCYDIARQR